MAALYKFARLDDCDAVRRELARLCCREGLKGTLLLASEGINGTVAGSEQAIGNVLAFIRALPGFSDPEVKYAASETMPFHRMKVRVKREIVTMGQPEIDPLTGVGHYVSPQDWNALISDPGTIVIDTRNDYEVAVGSFAGAIDPKTASFRDFPAWFRAERDRLLGSGRPPKVAMFCTGGIRCEKSTAFLKAEGLDEVYHLQGGILNYLETIPAEQSLWEGECFVFDRRVAVGHGLEAGTHVLCHGCRRPVSSVDQASPLYVSGISCPACHATRTSAQRAGYAERDRQEQLAQARGTTHIGSAPHAEREG
ncbi:MAG TPA: rhodanese-related sulfurtransferase [Sphingobium sp.]